MSSSTPKARVLIVEDEPELREMYAEWLADDYQVATAGDAPSALETLDASFEVVLLDRKLPEAMGEKLIPDIQKINEECQIAIVTSVEADWDVLEMDFDAYLTKPAREDGLRFLVESLCEGNDIEIAKRKDVTL